MTNKPTKLEQRHFEALELARRGMLSQSIHETGIPAHLHSANALAELPGLLRTMQAENERLITDSNKSLDAFAEANRKIGAQETIIADLKRQLSTPQAPTDHHDWIRNALKLPDDDAPYRFDYYAECIDKLIVAQAPAVPVDYSETAVQHAADMAAREFRKQPLQKPGPKIPRINIHSCFDVALDAYQQATTDSCSDIGLYAALEAVRKFIQAPAVPDDREPLSDGKIINIADLHGLPTFDRTEDLINFARAIESAHNISAKPAQEE